MEDLLNYRSSIAQKTSRLVPDLIDEVKAEKFWNHLETLEKRELDYIYALVMKKEIELLQEIINQ